MRNFLFRLIFPAILLLYNISSGFAQDWMDGYPYRRKITIDKNKVSPHITYYGPVIEYSDLADFPVLIEITDKNLVYIPGACGNKIENTDGKNISFALQEAPTMPLSFEVDSYDPSTGKLTCWVRIPALSAKGTASLPTSIYLYYGSDLLPEPYNPPAMSAWTSAYSRVWHMNQDILPAISKNARSNQPEEAATGSPAINTSNYIAAKVDNGIQLNGVSESLYSGIEISTIITISAWIKLSSIGTEQVIITNTHTGSEGTNGYTLKINAGGQLAMELSKDHTAPFTASTTTPLLPNNWYFINAVSSGSDIILFLNGIKTTNRIGSGQKLGVGGAIKIGAGEQGDQHFNGTIDELKIQNIARPTEWLQTEYANQNNPSGFYSVFAEEYNPTKFNRFTGSVDSLWNFPANWSNGSVPANNENVIIATGITANALGITNEVINQLILEEGATLSLNNNLYVNCTAQIKEEATIKINDGVKLSFGSDVINNGSIRTNKIAGTLVFTGNNPQQNFSGSGSTKIYGLENNQADVGNVLLLQAPIQIMGSVALTSGTLNSNNNLSLLSTSQSSTAVLLPVQNLNLASITGNVQVQKYISGNYPPPSTARGWRLLSSPVYTLDQDGVKYYNAGALKNSLFVTGPGGQINGFDPSPLNGGTVYTHDQSLPGSLSQKYVTIPDINTPIELGKGIYMFSRGSREVQNAFKDQIQTSPFSNPEGYTLTHTGEIYLGDLITELQNKNNNDSGDGFNLLGNPYPCPIKWGSLIRTNLSPFVWLYDPLNNAYIVSDLTETIIPSGSGFFVKVNNGAATGTLTFTETSKYIEETPQIPVLQKASEKLNLREYADISSVNHTGTLKKSRLIVHLNRDSFDQQYEVSFVATGCDEINDNDALKIGEGYVSIAGLVHESKLSIDERPLLTEKKEINLDVKGWGTGLYHLNLTGMESFNNGTSITLRDHFLNIQKKIIGKADTYNFTIDSAIAESQGSNRFMLVFEPDTISNVIHWPDELLVYPNPFTDKLFLKINTTGFHDLKVVVYNITGKIVLRQDIASTERTIEINGLPLKKELYFVQITDKKTGKIIKTFKVLKT